jgi:hypothetical protein
MEFRIQKKKDISEINQKIMTIPYYSDFFSPILETSPITQATIGFDEIREKENIINELDEYVMTKTRYIGKYGLRETIEYYKTEKPKLLSRFIVKTYYDLLEILERLDNAKIIHGNINENTILCRDVDGKPIIYGFQNLTTEPKHTDLYTVATLLGEITPKTEKLYETISMMLQPDMTPSKMKELLRNSQL